MAIPFNSLSLCEWGRHWLVSKQGMKICALPRQWMAALPSKACNKDCLAWFPWVRRHENISKENMKFWKHQPIHSTQCNGGIIKPRCNQSALYMPGIWHHITISLDLKMASTRLNFWSRSSHQALILVSTYGNPVKFHLVLSLRHEGSSKMMTRKIGLATRKICKQAALYGACIAISCQEFHVMSQQDIHRHSGNRWVAVVFALSALFLHAVIEKVLTTPSVCYVRVGTDANLLSFPIAIDTTKGCTVQTIWDDHMVKRGTSSVARDTIGPKLWYQCLNECFFCSYSTGTTSFEALTMPTYGSLC